MALPSEVSSARPNLAYGSRPIRDRRSAQDIEELKDGLVAIVTAEQPMTVRGVFYRAVAAGLIDKTEADYKGVVVRLLLQLRRDGRIPYRWITDGTRWRIKPQTFDDLEDFRSETADLYRRALWKDQPVYVEVFTEKDAIAGILSAVTVQCDVPLNVVRGFASESFLWSLAQDIIFIGKPTYLYYFGDWDPSGLLGAKDVEHRLRGFAPDAEILFKRVAVTPAQVRRWRLPTRPTKKGGTHHQNFEGDSIEVDAISAPRLRKLVTDCIERHIDEDRLVRTRAVEEVERESVRVAFANLRSVG